MKTLKALSVAVAATILSGQAFAAGYEKAVLFSGKYGGTAGAADSTVSGSEALYYNPAGIGMDHAGQQASVNFSPTILQSQATFNGTTKDANSEFLPPFSAIYSITPNGLLGLSDKWGFAVGVYSGAGLDTEYDNVSISSLLPYKYNFKTNLFEIEYSLGVSYKVMPHLKVGAAYRLGMVNAEFDGPNSSFQQSNLTNLSGWASSYRLGAQWSDDGWGAGVSVRGPMGFSATGDSSVGTPNSTFTSGTATVKTQLPLAVSVGGHYDFTSKIRGILQYAWNHYGVDKTLIVQGTGLSNVPQNFHDQSNFTVAGEYTGFSWPIRLGYVYSTKVEDPNSEIANFAPPAAGNTITVGTGHTFMTNFEGNAAFEYAFSSDSHANGATVGGAQPFAGKYDVNAYSFHLGLLYSL
jgi:long-subunit fatty acid transport protein